MTFNKKVLAGLVAFAAASSFAQAVTVAANDGWELGVSGFVNQFLVYTDDNNGDDFTEVRSGLLPIFLNIDVKSPTINGLDLAAHISFSPSTNGFSYNDDNNPGTTGAASTGGNGEQREAYFTVDGSFGQILAGKALGLYASHNILTEQTLFGVGYGTGGNGTTTLGGIGLGYDYADWRSQIKWTSPDLNGFKIALAIADNAGPVISLAAGKPTGPLGGIGQTDSEDLRYEGDLTYTGTFDGGNFLVWLSGVTQGDDVRNGADFSQDYKAWTVGGTLAVNGFEFMAQYSDSEGAFGTTSISEVEWSQFIVQAGYRFGGTTLVSANYAELTDDSSTASRAARYPGGAGDDSVERITVGVYHDVNANLKLVAEYTKVEDDNSDVLDQDIFALGGFVFF